MPGIPVVVSVHDTNPDLLWPSITIADKIFCVSYAVADLVKKKFQINDKIIRILPNRVNLSIHYPIETNDYSRIFNIFPNLSKKGKYILFIGRQTEQKNVDNMIKALKILPQEYSIIMIGIDQTNGVYKELAKQLQVDQRIFWLSSVQNSELPIWHAFSDCFCVPSRWEGFGIVFIEAAACGNAIITSNIAPMNEFLTHNENSFLVNDYENPQAIAAAIKEVVENENYRKTISNNALLVGKKFSKEKVDEIEISFYKEILEEKERVKLDISERIILEALKLKNLFRSKIN